MTNLTHANVSHINANLDASRDHRDALLVPDEQLTHAIIGVAIEVHRHLGPGLLESIYERAMQLELDRRQLPYRAQVAGADDVQGRSGR